MRGRSRSKGPNPLTRSYESNGPDVKVRGTAQHIAEKYAQLARDAQASGDPVAAENYLQHAEHYFRIILTAQEQYRDQFGGSQRPFGEDGEEDGGFGFGADRSLANDDGDPAMHPYEARQDRQDRQEGGERQDRPRFDRGDRFEGRDRFDRGDRPDRMQGQDRGQDRGQERGQERGQDRGQDRQDRAQGQDRGPDRGERFDRQDRGGRDRFQRPDRNRQDFGRPDPQRSEMRRPDQGRDEFSRPDGQQRSEGGGRFEGRRPEGPRDEFARQEVGRQEFGRQDFGRQESGRQESGRQDFGRPEPRGDQRAPRDEQPRPDRGPPRREPEPPAIAGLPAFLTNPVRTPITMDETAPPDLAVEGAADEGNGEANGRFLRPRRRRRRPEGEAAPDAAAEGVETPPAE